EPVLDCMACKTAADCNDGDPCTTDACNAGVCDSQPAASCSRCSSAADCNDSDPCTIDVCNVSGSCVQTPIQGCPGTGTGGGTGGGSGGGAGGGTGGTGGGTGGTTGGGAGGGAGVGTGSSGVGGNSKVAEICGDCQDNDGDGLVDYEDPDCCEQIDPLTLG